MRLLSLLAVVALACSGSSGTEKAAKAAPPSAEPAAAPAPPAAPPARAEEPRASARPRLRLSLRSTPGGATAAVDGVVVGETPLLHELPDDGRVHEFTFVKDGYALERYKIQPVQNGSVHATLRKVQDVDAGL